MKQFWTRRNRKALYTVTIAVLALLVANGLIDATQVPLWLALAAALLGIAAPAMALKNLPPKEGQTDDDNA